MCKKEYLLDTNIIIKVWGDYPSLLENIERSKAVDYKILRCIAEELSQKESKIFEGIPVLSSRFIQLLIHLTDESALNINEFAEKGLDIKYKSNSKAYYIDGNKLSKNDYSLLNACISDKRLILVTDDRKIIKSAALMLDHERVLTYDEFLFELRGLNLL